MPDVFDLRRRLTVTTSSTMVDTFNTADVNKDEVLGMIVLGKRPEGKPQAERAAP